MTENTMRKQSICQKQFMKKEISFCDLSAQGKRGRNKVANKTRFYKHKGNFVWQGIRTERYKDKSNHWANVIRRVLIGNQNESAKFHLRYFEILPGGFTSFEKHKHEHVVVGIKGKGKILCGKKKYEMNFLDTLYIAPDAPHQLSNPFHEPFGFFCIVNAKRDKPRIIKKRVQGVEESRIRGKNYKFKTGFRGSRGRVKTV
jgi:ribulose-bisphosphate carboxylase large chain